MDTSNLKKFATEARNILRKGVDDCLKGLGFDQNGRVQDDDRPREVEGGCIWRGNFVAGNGFYNKWVALEQSIVNHESGAKDGYKAVVEEASYTWFNRLVAIRILQKNSLIEPQLAYETGSRLPLIVANARRNRFPQMPEVDLQELKRLLQDDSKTLEQFSILIVAFCHSTPILSECFGHIDDYTELLLPQNILAVGGFIDLLNSTSYLTEEDYKQTELIGWLYQFYISEKKDEVFASFKKKKKAEADDIPAATQIFTPNWIVKYMVQNTLGRIYLDNKPDSTLAAKWKYLVDCCQQPIYQFTELEQLKVADFACGSGHILNEFFDMLYDFYMEDGASATEAVESIFKHNLIGIDLDTRAKQLSMFSLLLKACQKNAKFVDAKVLPRVISCQTAADEVGSVILSGADANIGRVKRELAEALALVKQAANLGSCIHFNISTETRNYLEKLQSCASIDLILALTDKYSAIAMNPPYMESGKMNVELSDYVRKNYPNSKADLFSVFMDIAIDRLADKAKYGMINMQSWMFLSSFEKLRKCILDCYHIENMIHLGPRTFDELSGEVVQNTAYIISKTCCQSEGSVKTGTYFRLVAGKNCSEKEGMFLTANSKSSLNHLDDKCIRFDKVCQDSFEQIPGCPIGYWVSKTLRNVFSAGKIIEDIAPVRQGFQTGDNDRFMRYWFEVSNNLIGFSCSSTEEFQSNQQNKYAPYNKGGSYRKWYGNNEYVVKFDCANYDILKRMGNCLPSRNLYFKNSLTWSALSSGSLGARYCGIGYTFSAKGACCFPNNEKNSQFVLAYFNSKVVGSLLNFLSPTLDFNVGVLRQLPVNSSLDEKGCTLVEQSISISKADWDAHEASWDFQKNELLAMTLEDEDANVQFDIDEAAKRGEMMCVDRAAPEPETLSWRMRVYQGKWERLFKQLHANEEELNRQFIEIYGLQDELTPDVPLDEVTILQQGEISIGKPANCNMSCNSPLVDNEQIDWHEDVVIKQFISYAIGCMMGRYRLDKPGLAIAHPKASEEEKAPYTYNGETFTIDDDGILPLMGRDSGFADDATNRFKDFLRIALGEESMVQNLNFVEECLGKSVEEYLTSLKGFWADHKKMYQNRPIYWLFSSKNGAFKCLAYMHRMNKNTVEQIRQKYLLKYIDKLRSEEESLSADEANLSGADLKKLTKIRKNLEECSEYHGVLHDIADRRIEFDLDDGVVVNYAKFGSILAKIK